MSETSWFRLQVLISHPKHTLIYHDNTIFIPQFKLVTELIDMTTQVLCPTLNKSESS